MVFRRDNKGDSFQRQISALRQQLGTDGEGDGDESGGVTPYRDDTDDAVADEQRPAPSQARPTYGSRDATFSFGDFGASATVDRQPEPVPSRPALPDPGTDGQTSVIAHDTAWKGDLQTEGTIHVHGRVEGSVTAEQDVYVAEEADVDATVTALNLVVAGTFRGTARCAGRFEVLPQGRATGDIQAPTLVIHEGAIVAGQVRMDAAETAPAEPPAPIVQRRAARGR